MKDQTSQGPRVFIRSKATCAAPLCEVLTPCRGLRPHHVQRDRIGTWEISCLAAVVTCCMTTAVRIGKVRSQKPMMHGHEKADLVIVAMKPANKAKKAPAEASAGAVAAVSVERMAGAKGNTHQQSTHGLRARIACQRRWSVYGDLCRYPPEAGAVCGKAARTDLGGGRALKRTALPLQRREFIKRLAGAAAARRLGSRAQQT